MLIQGILTSYLGMSLGKRHHLHLGEQNALSELLVINNHLPSQYQSYCAFEYQSFVVPATQNTSPFVSPDLDQSSCQDKQLGLNMGREKTITNQTNTGTVTNATLGKCLRDGVERTYGSFQSRRCGLELK